MARIRSSPRQAPRVTGDLYDSGYQFSPPDEFMPKFGEPWLKILPFGNRDLPADTLADVRDGIIVDGLVLPVWSRTVEEETDKVVLGTFSVSLIMGDYHLIFYKDVVDGDKLKINWATRTTNGVIDTALVVGDGRVCVVGWQNTFVFSSPDLTAVYGYDMLTSTLNTYVSSPAGVEFLFENEGNITAVFKSGSAYVVQWAVDSAPSDWTSFGAGTYVVPGTMGEVNGVARLGNSWLIAGRNGGVVMSSTGSLPAFRFDSAPAFAGAPVKYGMCDANDVAYFVDQERRLSAYEIGRTLTLPLSQARFRDEGITLTYLRSLNLVVISSTLPEHITLFMSPVTQQWVSTFREYWNFVADSPEGSLSGKIMGYVQSGNAYRRNVLDLGAAKFTRPEITTGLVHPAQPFWVHYVEVFHSDAIDYAPLLEVRCMRSDGSYNTIRFDESNRSHIIINAQSAKYFIDYPAHALAMHTLETVDTVGYYHPSLLDADGNFVAPTTPVEGNWRMDMNVQGNLVPSETSRNYNIGEVSPGGNQGVVLDIDQWPRNIGITHIRVHARSLMNDTIAA